MRIDDWVFTIFATLWVSIFFIGLSACIVWSDLAFENNYPIYWVAVLAVLAYLWDLVSDKWKQ